MDNLHAKICFINLGESKGNVPGWQCSVCEGERCLPPFDIFKYAQGFLHFNLPFEKMAVSRQYLQKPSSFFSHSLQLRNTNLE